MSSKAYMTMSAVVEDPAGFRWKIEDEGETLILSYEEQDPIGSPWKSLRSVNLPYDPETFDKLMGAIQLVAKNFQKET